MRRMLFKSHWMIIWVSLILSILDKFSLRRTGAGCCISLVNEGAWILWLIGSSPLTEEYVFGTGKMFSRTVLFPAKWKPLHLHKFPPSPLLQAFSQNFWTENAPKTVEQKAKTHSDCSIGLFIVTVWMYPRSPNAAPIYVRENLVRIYKRSL